MKPTSRPNNKVASANVTKRIQELGDWRGKTLAHLRQLIHDAAPDIQEEWKWAKPKSPGIPVWSHDGGICTGESYKQVVKLTFYRGASLKDPQKLFNSSLGGNIRRAIDFREGEKINDAAFRQLIRAAVAANSAARRAGRQEEVSPAERRKNSRRPASARFATRASSCGPAATFAPRAKSTATTGIAAGNRRRKRRPAPARRPGILRRWTRRRGCRLGS
jgi:hypothetical protein